MRFQPGGDMFQPGGDSSSRAPTTPCSPRAGRAAQVAAGLGRREGGGAQHGGGPLLEEPPNLLNNIFIQRGRVGLAAHHSHPRRQQGLNPLLSILGLMGVLCLLSSIWGHECLEGRFPWQERHPGPPAVPRNRRVWGGYGMEELPVGLWTLRAQPRVIT